MECPQLGFPRFRIGEEAWLDMRQEYSVATSVDSSGRVAVVAEVTSKGDKRHRLQMTIGGSEFGYFEETSTRPRLNAAYMAGLENRSHRERVTLVSPHE